MPISGLTLWYCRTAISDFYKLGAHQLRGELFNGDKPSKTFTIYEPFTHSKDCVSKEEAKERIKKAKAFAKANGLIFNVNNIALNEFGLVVKAEDCEAKNKIVQTLESSCDFSGSTTIDGQPLQISVVQTSIPQAPNPEHCQFFGHRFVIALQVSWRDFGQFESDSAPGGVAQHYDCREQVTLPLRLYAFDQVVMIIGGFKGANIADRRTYPFVVIMPRR